MAGKERNHSRRSEHRLRGLRGTPERGDGVKDTEVADVTQGEEGQPRRSCVAALAGGGNAQRDRQRGMRASSSCTRVRVVERSKLEEEHVDAEATWTPGVIVRCLATEETSRSTHGGDSGSINENK